MEYPDKITFLSKGLFKFPPNACIELEKNSFNNVTLIQFQGLQDLIYQQKDALMTLKTETGPMDMTPMFYELQNRIIELERVVNDHHSGNWN